MQCYGLIDKPVGYIITGLVLLGKLEPETIDVPMKIMGFSGSNVPLLQSIDIIISNPRFLVAAIHPCWLMSWGMKN